MKDNLDEEQKQELYGMMDENQGFKSGETWRCMSLQCLKLIVYL